MKIVSKQPMLVGTSLLLLACAGVYGCKDFLTSNEKPQGTLDQSILANASGVEGSLVAAYRALDCTSVIQNNWGCAASNWVWGSVAAGDSYKGSDITDQPPINDIELYHWGTADAETYLQEKWRITYEGIARANATLRLMKQVVAANAAAISAANQKGIAGEAIFLRAHYHFEAWRMWGNIPYYREDDLDFRKANLTSAAAVTEIIKDLDSAAKLLSTGPRNNEKGRVTSWTAKAYKGRVLVASGQYAAAIPVLEDVKTNGPYALQASFDQVWTGFSAYYNGPETIFAYQASANDGEPNGNNANYGERLNFPYSGSHFGCCGFNQPTQNLVNFFKTDAATGLPLSMVDANWNNDDATLTAARNTVPVDPRLDWTVGRDSVPYKDWGLFSIAGGWVRDIGNGGPYSPKKNAHEKASGAESSVGWQNTQLNSVKIHLFRYADLLLMLAESYVEANRLPEAMTIVNQIRTRAAVKAQGCGDASVATRFPTCVGHTELAVPINDPSIGWATYRIGNYTSFPNQAYARDAVRAERRIELAMEGQRFFDMRQYGQQYISSFISSYLTKEGTTARRQFLSGAEAFGAKHMLYPIPQLQIDLSKVNGTPALKQNTGW
jgi:hypothetical protein